VLPDASPPAFRPSAPSGCQPANALANIPAPTRWSLERVDQLRHHYRLGLTAAESAALLGGVSKNAVISKRTRLGLTGGRLVVRGPAEGRRGPQARPWRWRPEPDFHCEPLPAMDGAAPVGACPKPLSQHRPGECLWPLGSVESPGDWRTLFCCAAVKDDRRYCEAHASRARR
jgi:hypothetical protein